MHSPAQAGTGRTGAEAELGLRRPPVSPRAETDSPGRGPELGGLLVTTEQIQAGGHGQAKPGRGQIQVT